MILLNCIPTKTVTLGPRDPDFVTLLVKSLLCKCRKLRRQGKDVEADALAAKINRLICDYRKTRLSRLSETGPSEQGPGIGPTLWLIMESDLHPLSDANVIFNYADDTNLQVPENTDCTLADEFSQ